MTAENQVLTIENSILDRKCAHAEQRVKTLEEQLEKGARARFVAEEEGERVASQSQALQEDLRQTVRQKDALIGKVAVLEGAQAMGSNNSQISEERLATLAGELAQARTQAASVVFKNEEFEQQLDALRKLKDAQHQADFRAAAEREDVLKNKRPRVRTPCFMLQRQQVRQRKGCESPTQKDR